MFDKPIINNLLHWTSIPNMEYVLLIVITKSGSAPKKRGSAMLVNEHLEHLGSVSNGCIEGQLLKNTPRYLNQKEIIIEHFGISNETAWSVGLSCGGNVDILVIPSTTIQDKEAAFDNLHKYLDRAKPFTLYIDFNSKEANFTIHEDNQHTKPDKSENLQFVYSPPPRVFIIGATQTAFDLLQISKPFDINCILIDPRSIFTDYNLSKDQTPFEYSNLPPKDALEHYGFNKRDYLITLSHDPKIDDQALLWGLKIKPTYIGALGSSRTHAKRVERFISAGVSQYDIDLIESPLGMPIGSKSNIEIALSILGRLISVKNQAFVSSYKNL